MSEEQKGLGQASVVKKDSKEPAESAKDKDGPKLTSAVPERVEGALNPSSPGNTGTTPGTNAKVG